MEIKQLYYLAAVAESGSMHSAAEQLHVTQQNISRVLLQLENELEIQLFSRSVYGSTLTSEGEKVYKSAIKILKEIQLLQTSLNRLPLSKDVHGNLPIYFSTTINNIVDKYTLPFQKNNQNITITTSELTSTEILSSLHSHKINGVVFLQSSLDKITQNKAILSEHYHCYLLANEPLNLVVHKNNPLAKQSSVSLNTLSKYSFVVKTSSLDNLPNHVQVILDLGIQLNIKYCSTSETSLVRNISQNMFCCLTTKSNLAADSITPHDLTVIPIRERIYIALCVLFPKNTDCITTQAFHEFFVNNVSTNLQKIF